MGNNYRRCKDCGADRNDGVHISRHGRCPKCGEKRQHEFATKAREALERMAARAPNAPKAEKPPVISGLPKVKNEAGWPIADFDA